MNQHARITSTDELKRFRVALVQFVEEGEAGLMDILSEINRVRSFIEHESLERWRTEAKRRERAVAQARDELSRAEFAQRRTIEARRDLERARRQFEEAKAKLDIIRRWRDTLSREIEPRLGAVRNLSDTFARIAPDAIAGVDRVLNQIDAYLSVTPPVSATKSHDDADAEVSVARPIDAASSTESSDADVDTVLRGRGVPADSRRSLTGIDFDAWSSEPDQADQPDPIQLPEGVTPVSPPDESIVVVHPNAFRIPQVVFERASNADASDSGWTVSPLAPPETQTLYGRTTIGELRRRFPEWMLILSAPPGSLVVIANGSVERFEPAPKGVAHGRDGAPNS